MELTSDKEVYRLSRLLDLCEEGSGSRLLIEYWEGAGKLRYLPRLAGSGLSASAAELQYVVAAENLLSSLLGVLDSFVREPYCSEAHAAGFDETAFVEAADLLSALARLKSIDCSRGWAALYEELCTCAAAITSKVDRLVALYRTGKRFHFCTNVSAETLISGERVGFSRAVGNYFIAER